jgi:hypothetical protein
MMMMIGAGWVIKTRESGIWGLQVAVKGLKIRAIDKKIQSSTDDTPFEKTKGRTPPPMIGVAK